MNDMYEDINDIMVPDSTLLRETYHACHFGVAETVTEILGEYGPLNAKPCLEAIDNDPTINALLAAANFRGSTRGSGREGEEDIGE